MFAIANDIVFDFDRQTLECEMHLLEKKILTHQHDASAEVKVSIDKSLENDNLERMRMLTLPFWIIARDTEFLHFVFAWTFTARKIRND